MSARLLSYFYRIFFILVGNHDKHNSSDVFVIRPDLTTTAELAALECQNSDQENVFNTLAASIIIRSSSFCR